MTTSRRDFMLWSAMAVGAGLLPAPLPAWAAAAGSTPSTRRPVPLSQVRLLPSTYLDALQVNRGYLMRLEPDRLLHNFVQQAGLPPKAEVYGGWESDTIAGHTLGHYLSALALMHAQTGDGDCRARTAYIVDELARCQAAGGDGYVAGFTRKRKDGTIDGGRVVFEEVARGQIDALPFYLNGSWAPLYTWHKLFAGLLDTHLHCGNAQALDVALKLAAYLDGILGKLDETQMQTLLSCEFGGLNESFVELHARTGDARWLALARRLHHREVLDPLVAGRDELVHRHSNTNIPKVIGLAREYEVTGNAGARDAAAFFWSTVTAHHTYVIGGNGDREYFQQPDSISRFITEQTCEHCASYNMLKLTRQLHGWSPRAAQFDYYERTLHNHILAQQHPRTGMFTYMTPMLAGEKKGWSEPFDHFWCCVGSGMESHAQFTEAAFWQLDDGVAVNLYIPAQVRDVGGLSLSLRSGLPLQGTSTITVDAVADAAPRMLALRIPGWAASHTLSLNGKPVPDAARDGYVQLRRIWRSGDTLQLELPLDLRLEATGDDPTWVSVMRGPLLLAADLGDAAQDWDGQAPALIDAGDPLARFTTAAQAGSHGYRDSQGRAWTFSPFHTQYDRRSAPYVRRMTPQQWTAEQQRVTRTEQAQAALDARALDHIALGDAASEQAHALKAESSYDLSYRRRAGRDARTGGFIEFTLDNAARAKTLKLRYWGDETRRRFRILADGVEVAYQRLDGDHGLDFVDIDYPLPQKVHGRASLRIRIEPDTGYSAGPAFGGWLLA